MSTVDVQISALFKELRQVDTRARKTAQKMLTEASSDLINAAKNNIHPSTKPHKRYSTSKITSKLRAPKGKGNVVATYYPGNLARSIGVIPIRKKSTALLIGPRVTKGTKGTFNSNSKVDGYYAHMVEFATSSGANHKSRGFMRRAYQSTKDRVLNKVEKSISQIIDSVKRDIS